MVKVLLTWPEVGSHINWRKISIVWKSIDSFRNQAMWKLWTQWDLLECDDKQLDLFQRVREVEISQISYDNLTNMPLPLFDELVWIILLNPNLNLWEIDELLEIVEVSLENINWVLSSKLVKWWENVENSWIIVKMTRRDFSKLEMISENDFRQAVNTILSVPWISIKKINELLKNKKIEPHHIQASAA